MNKGIIDGNAKVGEAKVYKTNKDLKDGQSSKHEDKCRLTDKERKAIHQQCRINQLEHQIKDANEKIAFYAGKAWVPRILGQKDWSRINDIEQIEDKEGVDWNTGGKSAREYCKKYGVKYEY